MHVKNHYRLTILSALIFLVFPVLGSNPIEMSLISNEVGKVVVEVERALPKPDLDQSEQWYLLENGKKTNITRWERQKASEGINAVLVFDHSSGWAGTPFNWNSVKRNISRLIDGFDPERDSVALIGYASDVDMNTDLTDNLEVLKMILNGSEEQPGQAMAQAIEAATEALAPHSGKRAIFIVSSGYSEFGLGEVLREVDLPVFVLAPGYKEDWAYFCWQSGGMYEDLGALVSGKISPDEVRNWPIASTQITYVSTLGIETERVLELFAPNLSADGPLASISLLANQAAAPSIEPSVPGTGESTPTRQWLLYLIPGLFLLGGLIYLIRFWLFRTSKGTVQPGITSLQYNAKKNVLIAQLNIPIRTKPAKFTLHNHSGTPVRDQVVSGTTRKVKMDVSGLSEGLYKCSLSNAGMTSEQQDVVLG